MTVRICGQEVLKKAIFQHGPVRKNYGKLGTGPPTCEWT